MIKRKIVAQDYIRSLEMILRENPTMIAKDILVEQEYDKACVKLWETKRDKRQIELVKSINKILYYKGRFGIDQRFYYKFSNAFLCDKGRVYCDVETIVVFLGEKNSVISEGSIQIEKQNKTQQRLETYGISGLDKTTKEDFDSIVTYIKNIEKFWDKN